MRSVRGAPAMPALNALVDLFYPPTCGLCWVRLHPDEQVVCDPCRAALLPRDDWRCLRCGATGTGRAPAEGERCPYCPEPDQHFRGVLAATHYRAVSARCVHRFKYERRMEFGRLMADMMTARLVEPVRALEGRVGWVVPVPLHWRRRVWRGFNQSRMLAQRLADALEMPLRPDVLRRVRHTKMQVRVPKEKRAENVRGAFAVQAAIGADPPGILLIDDVVTSGHTTAECARVLVEAGVPQVWVASFARA